MTNSIDLIPPEYRESLSRKRHLRLAIQVAVVLVVALGFAGAGLARSAKQIGLETGQLRTALALSAQQQEQLAVLEARLQDLDEEWVLLRGLRSGAVAEDLFLIVDRALTAGDIWFLTWKFSRAGVVVPQSPRTVNTGYFIVVPQGETGLEPAAWQVQTHMTINGQARDHAALSRFVRALYAQHGIDEVKLDRTKVRQYAAANVIDFNMTITLRSEPAA